MHDNDQQQQLPPQEILRLDDRVNGLSGVIVLHSTRLGPAAGGCRILHYGSDSDATADAMRLAEGMTYKNALAELPLGGGKAVIRLPAGEFDRAALFRSFGRAVASLHGRYLTAEDVGTSVSDMVNVAQSTRYVAGLPAKPDAPGGDPSGWTALGVFHAMEVAVARRLGKSLSDVTVGVQGLGNVGFALCKLLHEAGAKLVIAEPRSAVAAKAAVQFGAHVTSTPHLLAAGIDVLAPCALGAIIDAQAVHKLQAKIVCGAANNQLASPAQGAELAARDILYAPDYLVNAGGIINVAAEYFGWSEVEVKARVGRIGVRLNEVLDLAERDRIAPHKAADFLAHSLLAGKREAALAA